MKAVPDSKLSFPCPDCGCGLDLESASLAFARCPRCNAYVEQEVICKGSCLGCHQQAEKGQKSSSAVALVGQRYPCS